MRSKRLKTSGVLFLFCLLLLSLPKAAQAGLRSLAIAPFTWGKSSMDVVYREPSSWTSFFWIGAGGRDGVLKNSPVMKGDALIGIVETVMEKRSRVRLLTDPNLHPSVRAVRGSSVRAALFERLDTLIEMLAAQDDLDVNVSELEDIKAQLGVSSKDLYLAKGEMCGSASPIWRTRSHILKGIGFNYDFPDAPMPAEETPLKLGDLLVTTGMDGLFPPGLQVAVVTKIAPLHEGQVSYEIEAIAAAGNFEDISSVQVLPPVE